MKIIFYIEAIYYHPENPSPSVVIAIRNNIENITPGEPVFVDKQSDMKKVLKDLFLDTIKIHKTSFMVGLDEYHRSGMMVGDRLEVEMKICNDGEITN